ncbi:Rne/Rng family ribonuclease, partial [Actinotalea ferrariae]|uniref:Rne/Rng family ribonuclease n=1 Tax=Actinotalea ferrariae TaxID=1386098 RepID=UPI0021AB850E
DTEADEPREAGGRRRRRSGRGRGADAAAEPAAEDDVEDDEDENGEGDAAEGDEQGGTSSRRRRRRRRARGEGEDAVQAPARTRARASRAVSDEVTALKGSTRLEAKRQRRREGRDAGRRRTIVTESEFLARREAVDRAMVVRESDGRVQIAVLEDGVLVEHFVSRTSHGQNQTSMAGNVYLGRVQNVLPSMEAAFVDVGKGRNAVLYAGEVNWDAAGLEGQPRRIEQALKSGDSVLVQVTKDPIGHKGARLTSQITLAGRYLVYVPAGGMTGISRKLPENERARLKKLLKEIVPDAAGVIVRTAAEGASEEELRADVQRLQDQWAAIEKKAKTASAPALLQGEPDLAIRVVRDIFNDDFSSLVVQGEGVWSMISDYVDAMAPDLVSKVSRWSGEGDVFGAHRIDEQLAKGMDRKVYLPSGGSLVIDRTEAMTVVDVNTGKFTGSGGTLEETVTRNNIEAAEEIVRQLRLRDIGGIIVIDFIDMVLESNRDLVLRRLVECLGRDRTKHQVAEVTSLGLVQMTRKRVGQGLVEAFSETCQHCNGRGFIVHNEPVEVRPAPEEGRAAEPTESKRSRRKKSAAPTPAVAVPVLPEAREAVKATLATIAAAAAHAHDHDHDHDTVVTSGEETTVDETMPDEATPDEPVTDPTTPDETTPDAQTSDQPTSDQPTSDEAADAELGDALSSIAAVEAPVPPVTEDDSKG